MLSIFPLGNFTSEGFRVSWQDNTGNNINTRLYISKINDFSTHTTGWNGTSIGSGSGGNYIVTGLDPDTEYYVRVQGEDNSNNLTGYSQVVSGFTNPAGGLQQEIPGAFIVSNVTDTSFDLNWGTSTSPVAAEYYEVSIATDSTFINPITNTVNSGTSFIFTGLTPNTDYWARVRAFSTTGGFSSYNFIGLNAPTRTLETFPAVPTGVAFQNPTISTFEVIHDNDVRFSNGYIIEGEISNVPDFSNITIGWNVVEFNNPQIVQGTNSTFGHNSRYYVRLRRKRTSDNEVSLWSSTIEAYTLPEIPNSVGIKSVNLSIGRFLIYEAIGDYNTLNLTIRKASDSTILDDYDNKPLTITSPEYRAVNNRFRINVPVGITYNFTISLENPAGQSEAYSGSFIVPPPIDENLEIPVISIDSCNNESITFSWTQPSYATKYYIWVRDSINSATDFSESLTGYSALETANSSITVSGLNPDTPYQIRIQAESASNDLSRYSILEGRTSVSSPLNARIEQFLNYYIIRYDNVSGALDYRIDISDQSDFSTFFNVPGPPNYTYQDWILGTIAGDFRIYNFTSGTTYYIRMQARGENGKWSEYSTVSSIEALAIPPTPVITSVVPGARKVTFNWESAGNLVDAWVLELFDFNPQLGENSGRAPLRTLFVDGDETSIQYSVLQPDTDYWYRMRATNDLGESGIVIDQFKTLSLENDPEPLLFAVDIFEIAEDCNTKTQIFPDTSNYTVKFNDILISAQSGTTTFQSCFAPNSNIEVKIESPGYHPYIQTIRIHNRDLKFDTFLIPQNSNYCSSEFMIVDIPCSNSKVLYKTSSYQGDLSFEIKESDNTWTEFARGCVVVLDEVLYREDIIEIRAKCIAEEFGDSDGCCQENPIELINECETSKSFRHTLNFCSDGAISINQNNCDISGANSRIVANKTALISLMYQLNNNLYYNYYTSANELTSNTLEGNTVSPCDNNVKWIILAQDGEKLLEYNSDIDAIANADIYYNFTKSGVYIIKAEIKNCCGTKTLSKQIYVYSNPSLEISNCNKYTLKDCIDQSRTQIRIADVSGKIYFDNIDEVTAGNYNEFEVNDVKMTYDSSVKHYKFELIKDNIYIIEVWIDQQLTKFTEVAYCNARNCYKEMMKGLICEDNDCFAFLENCGVGDKIEVKNTVLTKLSFLYSHLLLFGERYLNPYIAVVEANIMLIDNTCLDDLITLKEVLDEIQEICKGCNKGQPEDCGCN